MSPSPGAALSPTKPWNGCCPAASSFPKAREFHAQRRSATESRAMSKHEPPIAAIRRILALCEEQDQRMHEIHLDLIGVRDWINEMDELGADAWQRLGDVASKVVCRLRPVQEGDK